MNQDVSRDGEHADFFTWQTVLPLQACSYTRLKLVSLLCNKFKSCTIFETTFENWSRYPSTMWSVDTAARFRDRFSPNCNDVISKRMRQVMSENVQPPISASPKGSRSTDESNTIWPFGSMLIILREPWSSRRCQIPWRARANLEPLISLVWWSEKRAVKTFENVTRWLKRKVNQCSLHDFWTGEQRSRLALSGAKLQSYFDSQLDKLGRFDCETRVTF